MPWEDKGKGKGRGKEVICRGVIYITTVRGRGKGRDKDRLI